MNLQYFNLERLANYNILEMITNKVGWPMIANFNFGSLLSMNQSRFKHSINIMYVLRTHSNKLFYIFWSPYE